MVWVMTLALSFMVMYAWYITQPLLVGMIDRIVETAESNSWNTTQFDQGMMVLKPIAHYWGVLVILGIFAFGFISSQRQEWRSGYA